MGLWDTIKGWFNIGGVSVKITQVIEPFPRENTVMEGAFTLTTKIPKTVLSTRAEFYFEETVREEKDGKVEEKTKQTSLGLFDTKKVGINTEYPFEMAAGETRQMSFLIANVSLGGVVDRMAAQKGMIGTLGKAVVFTGELVEQKNLRYFVQVTADVKGAAFDPSDRVQIRVVPGRS